MLSQESNPYDITVSDATWSPTGAFMSGTISNPTHGGINYNSDHRVSTRNSSTQDISLNVQWRVNPDWTITNDFQRVVSRTAGFDSDVATGVQMPSQTIDLTGDQPKYVFSPSDIQYLADPSHYYWGYTMEHLDRQVADSKAWKTDVKYSFDNPVLRDIRFGVRLQNRNGVNRNTNPSYNWQGVTQPWMTGWQINHLAYLNDPRFAGGSQLMGFNNFFNGDASVPAVIFPTDAVARNYPGSYATLHTYHDILCKEQAAAQGWGSCDPWVPATFGTDPAGVNDQKEKTGALYSQMRFGFDDLKFPIDGNVGLRYVKTQMTAHGYTVFTPTLPDMTGVTTVSGPAIPNIPASKQAQDFSDGYHNLLPSLNLRMKVSDKLQFRMGLSSGISRPDFTQLQGYTTLSETVNATTNTATHTMVVNNVSLTGTGQGNPHLRPVSSKQIDLTGEWYFAPSGSLTVAVFNKQLKDIIVNQSYAYNLPDVNGKQYTFTVTGPVNGAKGHARGIEIAYQQYFDKLPGWLSGFGVQANYTFLNSKQDLYHPVYQAYCSGGNTADNYNLNINGCDIDGRTFGDLPLQGLSRQSYNLALMYDKGKLSSRLAWSWRSKNLQNVNVNGTQGTDGTDTNPASATKGQQNVAWALPTWADSYGQLDGSIFYNISDNLSIGLEAQNLTNSKFRQLMQQHVGFKGRAWFVSGPRYTAQMRYQF